MKECKVDVLGTEYTLRIQEYDEGGGECNFVDKEIIVNIDHNEDMLDYAVKHELIHAFMFESGLGSNSEWAHNEECVDWISMQLSKIVSAITTIRMHLCE